MYQSRCFYIKRIICIGVVAVVAVCAALLAHFFPGNSADGSADIVRASVDENGIASFGCKSDNDYAGLVLNRKDKTFNFMQSYRFSAALSGTYEEDDDYLILTAKNSDSQSKFTFKKQKDGLEFLAKKSDSVREFCYSADSEKTDKCLKNKALFTPESIRTDVITYIGKNEHDGQKDYVEIVLSPADGSYSMYRSGMSDCSTGTYEEKDNRLVLSDDNGRDKYYFEISGNEIALDSAKSAKTSYIYSDAVLEKLAGGQHPSDVLESYFKS